MLVLNALLGLGTALASAFVAVFVGLGFWWGLPVLSAALLVALLLVSARLPLQAGARASGPARCAGPGLPVRFWFFAAFAVLYGICETMNGNWSQLDMTTRVGASATQASFALAAFWGMVTVGRVLSLRPCGPGPLARSPVKRDHPIHLAALVQRHQQQVRPAQIGQGRGGAGQFQYRHASGHGHGSGGYRRRCTGPGFCPAQALPPNPTAAETRDGRPAPAAPSTAAAGVPSTGRRHQASEGYVRVTAS